MPDSNSQPSQRQLSRAQMAFVRCWAEGLDLQAAWNRYLFIDGPADARRARTEQHRLVDRLGHLARALGRPDVAALLRRDPQAIVDRGPPLPTLEEFRRRQPSDFYSEAELAALYRDEFGAPDARGPERRRQRLRERLVLALQWLERVGVRDPVRTDALAAWLDERVAARLAAGGLRTLGDLIALIGSGGARWHRGIPRVGVQAAARLERWLGDHERTLGPLPEPRAPSPQATHRTGIVPLERFVTPRDLDGSAGTNRASADPCGIDAANDAEAIGAWLGQRPSGSHTGRAYRKEAERFLLWSVLERGKPLSSLDGRDCLAYVDFLRAPGDRWRAPRNTPRDRDDWRPFEAGLSEASAQTAVAVVRALCEWLARRRYLRLNPWHDLPVRARSAPPAAPRAFAPAHWARVEDWLAAQPDSPAIRRLRLVVGLAYDGGLRISELAAARLSWLHPGQPADATQGWMLCVPGPGDATRLVPLTGATVAALRAVLRDRGLAPDAAATDPGLPVLSRATGASPLSAARIHQLLVAAFDRCSNEVARVDPAGAQRIRSATARWLRNTHAVHAGGRGVSADEIRTRLGHRSLATTARYLVGADGLADALAEG